MQKKLKSRVRMGGVKLFDVTSGGCSIHEMCGTLDNLAYYEDFVADVILIDYADIVEAGAYYPKEELHKINQVWKDMKRDIAQKRDTLVITGSQLGRDAVDNDGGISSIAGNIRKFDHVSHWITLNQNKVEKKAGIMRTTVDGRHENHSAHGEVVCLQALDISRPILASRWKKDVENYKDIVANTLT